MIDKTRLHLILNEYKKDFPKLFWTNKTQNEKYKWVAVKHFQDNWDIEAPDFLEMFTEATAKTENLLSSLNYFPRGMMIEFCKADPEEVRKMFRALFDENVSVVTRVEAFIRDSEHLRVKYQPESGWKSHYQNANSITTYLWLKYPDKYYIYKYSECKSVANELDNSYKPAKGAKPETLLGAIKLYDAIAEYLATDKELVNLVSEHIDDTCYPDPKFRTLAIDVGFYISRYYSQGEKPSMEKVDHAWYVGAVINNIDMLETFVSEGRWENGYKDKHTDEVKSMKPGDKIAIKSAYTRKNVPFKTNGTTVSVMGIKAIGTITGNSGDGRNVSVKWDKVFEPVKEWFFFTMRNVLWHVERQEDNWMYGALLDFTFADAEQEYDKFLEVPFWKDRYAVEEEVLEDIYWPSLEEYNPNLSKEDWKKYILEVELPNHPSPMKMLKAMIELGGEASCKQLAKTYGGTPNVYIGCTTSFGGRVKKYFNLPDFTKGDRTRVYPIPFLGRSGEDNDWIYRIRPELFEALNEIDLSNISPYYDEETFDPYTKADFLKDVYISEEKYDTCVSRLKNKKNLILQGAPGVGKTFAARRLAWSIMGIKDNNRIEFVQFHQSYSYEDFIMGYKPDGNGFSLENGIFYDFCIKAKEYPDKDYFFIIDEINRGNMSKIFGELLMLIENDYRDMEITLAYDKKPFSIPENLYIIGMMNTADRSLAMIDYALRRRFSFVEMTPGFDSEGFETYQSTINNNTFGKLIGRIKALNADIENDASLGKGFCIGHSYFCNLKEDCPDAVLKEIVEYDIIPMLEEYWFDDEAKAKNWSNDLSGVFNG